MKKLNRYLLFIIYSFLLLSYNTYGNGRYCLSLFERLIEESSFSKDHEFSENLKIDSYDISLTKDSIFFKVYSRELSGQNVYVLGWVKYDYKEKQLYDNTFDELNPKKIFYNKKLEDKFINCLKINKLEIVDFITILPKYSLLE